MTKSENGEITVEAAHTDSTKKRKRIEQKANDMAHTNHGVEATSTEEEDSSPSSNLTETSRGGEDDESGQREDGNASGDDGADGKSSPVLGTNSGGEKERDPKRLKFSIQTNPKLPARISTSDT